jgi:NADPH:quinone reductase-like Zn-dependent oxidoreductase
MQALDDRHGDLHHGRWTERPLVVLAKPDNADLTLIGEWIKSGKIVPVIDRCYRLKEVPEAIRYLQHGHARGKVIITLGNSS